MDKKPFTLLGCSDLKEKLTSCLLMGHELSAKNNSNKDLMRHIPYFKENKEEDYTDQNLQQLLQLR